MIDRITFENGRLVKVDGHRPEYLSGNALVRLVKLLGEALLAAHNDSKTTKQRQEIARLTREVEQLKSDKANLLFDLNKARAHIAQLEENQC